MCCITDNIYFPLTIPINVFILMMGTSANHFSHVLGLLVNSRGPQDGTLRRLLADQHLHRTGLCQLAEKLVETLGILRKKNQRRRTQVSMCEAAGPQCVREK